METFEEQKEERHKHEQECDSLNYAALPRQDKQGRNQRGKKGRARRFHFQPGLALCACEM